MTLWIDVGVGKRQLILYDASVVIKRYPIAVGKMLTPTPTGNYMIVNKEDNPEARMELCGWGYQSHYGIHGTDNPSSIGTEASQGCIRMYNEDVLELSALVPLGTNVYIHK